MRPLTFHLQHHLPVYPRGAGPEKSRAVTMATTSMLSRGESAAKMSPEWINSRSNDSISRIIAVMLVVIVK